MNVKEMRAMAQFLNDLGELRGRFDVDPDTIVYMYKGLEVEVSEKELNDLYSAVKRTAETSMQYSSAVRQRHDAIDGLLTRRLLHAGVKRVEAAKEEE